MEKSKIYKKLWEVRKRKVIRNYKKWDIYNPETCFSNRAQISEGLILRLVCLDRPIYVI